MRFSFTAAALAALVGSSAAHTLVTDVWVNGKSSGDGRSKYIRSPPNNNPVKDLTSPDIVCNVNGAKAGTTFAKAAAGDSVQFQWYHNSPNDDILDSTHKGPVITYIAPYTESAGTGAIWSKLAESGFEGGKWATDTLIANKGMSPKVTIPTSLKAGKYLVRQEIIALHEADTTFNTNSARGAQFYPSCAQLEITGTGSDVPNTNFDFNKGYTYADTGIKFNVYSAAGTSYKIPGPAVWKAGAASSTGGGSASPAPVAAPVTTPATGSNDGCKVRRSRKVRRSAE